MQSWMIVSAVAVFSCGWLPTLLPLLWLVAASGLLGLALLWARSRWLGILLVISVSCSYASYWGASLMGARLPVALEGQELHVTALVLEPPQWSESAFGASRQRFSSNVWLQQCQPPTEHCRLYLGKVLLSYYGETRLRAGQYWQFIVSLKQPRGLANPAGYNVEAWLAQHRFVATGSVRDRDLQQLPLPRPLSLLHQQWRQGIADALQAAFPVQAQRSVLLALSTGDRSAIDPGLWQAMQRYGLNHLVVISGLHVGLIAAVIFGLSRPLGRRSAHLLAAAAALVYSALAGFSLPTLRALVMLASVQLVAIAGRKIRPLRTLSLALLVIALVDPLATHSAGFWLSFAAVGLIFYLRAMHPQLSPRQFGLVLQLLLSMCMGLLASYWYGGLGVLAPLANLLAVPILAVWLVPLCMLAACLLPVSEVLAIGLWRLAALPVDVFVWLDRHLQARNWDAWLHYQPTLGELLAYAAALLLLLAGRQLPYRWLAVALLCLGMLLRNSQGAVQNLEVWVLDVGQGLAVVLQTRNRTIVYDTGAGDPAGPNMATAVLIPFLEQRRVEEIDLLVISHRDQDHASGVYSLHRRFPVATTLVGDRPFPGVSDQVLCQRGLHWPLGELNIEVFGPGPGMPATSSNNRSCVLRISWGGFAILLPGDVDANQERSLVLRWGQRLRSDILLVSHHGSRSSSSSPFLAAVQPEYAVLSRGYRNRFGHPHPEVIAGLTRRHIAICDTAAHGALGFEVAAGVITQVYGWRHKRSYYWSGAASPVCARAYNDALVMQ